MSIAVSAVIKPSRGLRVALAIYALAGAGAAMALAGVQAERFHFPYLIAALCMLGAVVAWRAARAVETTRGIDISGLGEIRLTVQHSMGAAAPEYEPAQLLPGSTVWPSLLLLLLRDGDNGVVTVMPILPDSVSPEQFRKLGVSIRTIARRDNKFFGKHKIL
jgi:hypothetical protein